MRNTLRLVAALLAAGLLSACVGSPQYIPPTAPPPPRDPGPVTQTPPTRPAPQAPRATFRDAEVMQEPGLQSVIRANARSLEVQFGAPQLSVREGDMQKLQFAGSACVLDVFLYPPAQGGEPLATWVEARRASDGAAVDRAACVAALRR